MKLGSVSTSAINQALRYQVQKMQADLLKGQTELSTGKVADVGLELGTRTGLSVSLARDVSRLNSLVDSNALVSSRLTATQNVLEQLTSAGDELMTTLTAALSDSVETSVVQQSGTSALSTMTGLLNSALNGEYLFAGINTDVQPLADFADPASANRVAFDQAFQAYFGFSQTDAAAAGISGTQMEDFLDTVVEPMFSGSGWSDWSSASDDTITSRIGLNETAETSVSANISGVQKLAFAAAVVSSLLTDTMSGEAASVVVNRATTTSAEAVADLTAQSAMTGVTETRVSSASTRIQAQIDLFETNISDLEGVDPYEVSTRVNALLTQIETAYSLTARLQQLSLLNYL